MTRTDISNFLIHFTKGDSDEDAFKRLQKIISEKCLRGSTNLIKGEYCCISFSEAPLGTLSEGLVNPQYYSRYSPFGIMVSKEWLFVQGGRPVIYQTDDEFNYLPESHRWRHVRYEPMHDPPIDFTWEREWRICCSELPFDSDVASIIVPDEGWAGRLIRKHEKEQDFRVMQYKLIFTDEMLAHMFYEPFRWKILTLQG